jgi:shikimate kinase / 3-dehydroquinate synthase
LDSPLEKHLALIGFMGAGKSTMGEEVARRIGRPYRDLDLEIEAALQTSIASYFAEEGEEAFRKREAAATATALRDPTPSVLALGGGAVTSSAVREELRRRAVTVLVDVDVETAWQRAQGGGRPLAQEQGAFVALYDQRRPIYVEAADAVARDSDDAVLAAAGIHVEAGALERLGELVPGDGPVALVSDPQVAGIHGADAQLALGSRVVSTHEVEGKTLDDLARLWAGLGLDRTGTVVGLGGGVTTDLAGFAAATYMRGVAWASVPTSLVGQVDAAIGGKTGVDLPEAKNLAGAFHWPERTVIDPALLKTLPAQERRMGMAEVVKTGLLAGEPLWELPDVKLVRRCAAFKAAVCLRDPHEQGERKMLNLGHTFAHALETGSSYRVQHGEAVALGLLAALRLSGLETVEVEKILSPEPVPVDRERAWAALRRDKKSTGGRLKLVLLDAPGKPLVDQDIPEDVVRAELEKLTT